MVPYYNKAEREQALLLELGYQRAHSQSAMVGAPPSSGSDSSASSSGGGSGDGGARVAMVASSSSTAGGTVARGAKDRESRDSLPV